MSEKFRYVKNRIANAVWRLRKGKFDLVFKRIWVEIRSFTIFVINYSKPPGSTYTNKRKVIPPSYRPTGSRYKSPAPLQVDEQAIKAELESILATLVVREEPK